MHVTNCSKHDTVGLAKYIFNISISSYIIIIFFVTNKTLFFIDIQRMPTQAENNFKFAVMIYDVLAQTKKFLI